MRLEILLVDDNPGQVYLVRKALERWKTPYNLSAVGSAEEALEFVHRRNSYAKAPRPHLALLDLQLPKEPGFAVLDAIKNNPLLWSIAVIVFSSSNAQSDVKRAMELHADAYFRKPEDFDAMERMFEALESFWRFDARFLIQRHSGSIEHSV